jgi:hypothetical protein
MQMLSRHEPYRELEAAYIAQLRWAPTVERFIRLLERSGYCVYLGSVPTPYDNQGHGQ